MNKYPVIYYISQGKTPETHLASIEKVCRAGCQFVQLRLKNTTSNTVLSTAKTASEICESFQSRLIVNDHLDAIENFPLAGLHIGKNDIGIKEARQKLPKTLIGGTANTLQDCIKLAENGADYIGLGPFRFTHTKTNLDPILGLNGYQAILTELKKLKINIPIYAIGGIQERDIDSLLNIGLTGVAMSGTLTNKSEKDIKQIISRYG